MDIELESRVCALELLTAQLISEYLRTVPDPNAQASWAREQLVRLADDMAMRTDRVDEEARFRAAVKEHIRNILDQATARAVKMPMRQPSYPASPG